MALRLNRPELRHPLRVGLAAAALCAAAAAQALDLPLPPLPPLSPPGLPGRVDISRLPLPQVVVQTPTIIIRPPPLPTPPGVVVTTPAPPRTAPPPAQQPVYMWVPPGHRKDWAKHCGKYKACGVPVLFVRDDWYDRHVHPEKGGKGHGKGKGEDGGDGKGRGKGHGKGD
jgi:hypothetical protein